MNKYVRRTLERVAVTVCCRRTKGDGVPIDPEHVDVFPLAKLTNDKATNAVNLKLNQAAADGIVWLKSQRVMEANLINLDCNKIFGQLIMAEGESNKFVIFLHGYRNCGVNDGGSFLKWLHDLGYNVLLVDQQACGKSQGDYESFGLVESRDTLQWIYQLIHQFGPDIKIALFGVSMGATTALMTMGHNAVPKQVVACISDCAYTTAEAVINHMAGNFHIKNAYYYANRGYELKTGENMDEVDALSAVKNMRQPVLFIHGDKDATDPTSMAHDLYSACASADKELYLVEGANHAQSSVLGKDYRTKVAALLDRAFSAELPE